MVSQLCNNSITKNTEICPVWISHFKDSYFFFCNSIYDYCHPWKLEEGARSPGATVTSGCELLSWVLGINLRSLEKGLHALKYWAISSAQYSHFKNEIIGKFIEEVAQLGIKGKRLVWKYGGGGWRERLMVTAWLDSTTKELADSDWLKTSN